MEFSFVCEQARAIQLKEEAERLKLSGGLNICQRLFITHKNAGSESEPSAQTHSWMAAYAPNAGDRRRKNSLALVRYLTNLALQVISQLARPQGMTASCY